MSDQIPTSFVKQFSANVFHLSQQKGSRLAPLVRNETQRGDSAFFDRIGAATATQKTSRHMDTPQIDTPHSRRRVTLVDYVYADLIDSADKIRSLNDPTSDYAMAAMWAMGRAKDDEIISAALGTAYGGVDGSSSVPLGNGQKVVATDGVDTDGVNLNVATLRRAKKTFDANDVDEMIMRHIVISSSQLESLLDETEVTSSDFNTVKALVRGEINTFLGFNFVRSERLDTTDSTTTFTLASGAVGSGSQTLAVGARRCFAWAQDGILLSTGMEVRGRISERDDKNYSTQVFAEMGVGSTRMEEEKVVEILCAES